MLFYKTEQHRGHKSTLGCKGDLLPPVVRVSVDSSNKADQPQHRAVSGSKNNLLAADRAFSFLGGP
jgi:hypothetical protein